MVRLFLIVATAGLLAVHGAPAVASGLKKITSEAEFEGLVTGRKLTTLGVTLEVFPDGRITGRAFGRDVSGQWRWQDGYFCRDLMYGEKPLAPNCQAVLSADNRIRFVSDQGSGQAANLQIR